MYYVGLNIHQRSTSVEILDCNGKLVKRGEWKLPWDPCQDASADKNRLGHITRDGPPTVRKLLVEAAWQSVRRSPTIKAFYDRVTRNDPDRKKIAIVATAHYLTRVEEPSVKVSGINCQTSWPATAAKVSSLTKVRQRAFETRVDLSEAGAEFY